MNYESNFPNNKMLERYSVMVSTSHIQETSSLNPSRVQLLRLENFFVTYLYYYK
jgi:hypothetical protein